MPNSCTEEGNKENSVVLNINMAEDDTVVVNRDKNATTPQTNAVCIHSA